VRQGAIRARSEQPPSKALETFLQPRAAMPDLLGLYREAVSRLGFEGSPIN
jgi:hypothetical protein